MHRVQNDYFCLTFVHTIPDSFSCRYEKILYSVNTHPIGESPALKVGVGQILSVTEIAPKSRFLCVNGSAKAIRHSVTLALV